MARDAIEGGEQKVELRELVVRAAVKARKLVRGGAKLALAGRLGNATHYVLPCFFCLRQFDSIFGCARWPVVDDDAGGNKTGNANPGGLDCTGR